MLSQYSELHPEDFQLEDFQGGHDSFMEGSPPRAWEGGQPVHPPPYALHHIPYTLQPTPYTLHPAPYTLHLTPYTLHPTPYTLHPTPYTPHHTPRSLTLKLSFFPEP